MSVRSVVSDCVARVAEQQGKALAPLSDDLPLSNSGLDSLCLAIVVASLDDELGLDPFSADGPLEFPVTFGDFIKLYENASVSG